MSRRRLQQFFPGETVRIRVTFKDEAEAPTAVGGVTFEVKKPDGIKTFSPAIQETSSVYYTDIVANLPGDWAVRAAGATPSDSADEIQFTVVPSLVLA